MSDPTSPFGPPTRFAPIDPGPGYGVVDEVADVEEDVAVVGDVVTVSWLDTATATDVVRYGTVVDVVDQEGTGPAVRVAFFEDVSGPLPLDHTVHGRVDAPRVERLPQEVPWEVAGDVDLEHGN